MRRLNREKPNTIFYCKKYNQRVEFIQCLTRRYNELDPCRRCRQYEQDLSSNEAVARMRRRIKFKKYNYIGKKADDPSKEITGEQKDEKKQKRKLVHKRRKEGINTCTSTRRLRRSKHRKRIIKR